MQTTASHVCPGPRVDSTKRIATSSRALLAAALLALALGAGLYELIPGSRSAVPVTRAAGAHALAGEGLLSLPAVAQAPVSQALGADSRAYLLAANGSLLSATNAAQRLHASFTAAGVQVRSGRTHLGMRLVAAGFGPRLAPVVATAPRAHLNRVTYAHPGIGEWYVNGPLGLEQGFTLTRAPAAHAAGPLTLSIALSSNARVSLAHGGQTVLLGAPGARSLQYTGLRATDADGRVLRSWLSLAAGRILLRVDAAGARYPLRIDPLLQDGSKLTGSGESGKGELGWSVAISANGTTALVGGPHGNTTGGAAWVFTRSGSTWTQQGEKLTPSEPTGANEFGYSVALSENGNTALIGGRGAEAAWAFTRSGSTWSQQAKLTGEGATGSAEFGRAVALSAEGNTALVSGPSDNFKGAVWVFTRSGSTWTQQGSKLTTAEETGEGIFGWSVALSASGNTALIGASENAGAVGAAWVFTRSGSTWTQQAKLTGAGENGSGEFGEAVALSAEGNTALVGASVNDTSGANEGAGFVYVRSGESWSQQAELLPVGEAGAGEFGYSVALSANGNTALLGGPYDNSSAGAAWVFTRSGEKWSQQGEKLTGTGASGAADFGRFVALSGNADWAIIGGYADNGEIGAAWAFGSSPTVVTDPGTEVTTNSERLNATVNPGGQEVTACKFEYGTTTAYGKSETCTTKPGSGEGPVAVSAVISGLTSNTTYHFRIVATNAQGTADGADETFTTLATFNSGETKEESKPAKAKEGELSAEASGGKGTVAIGPYGSDIGGPGLRTSNGKYLDVYRSTSATFNQIEFKDCELGGAKTIWWYDPSAGWLPISEPTARYTETPTPCITVTITTTSTPDVAQMTGMRYGVGGAAGAQEYGKCVAHKKGNYTEGACETVAEKNGAPDHKGHFEWLPSPQVCYAKKHSRYAESACATRDEKKGKPKGKFEAGSDAFSGSSGAVVLELKGFGDVECEASSASGTLTALKTATETLTLTGCKHESAKCQSAGQAAGTIRTAALVTLVYQEAGKYYTAISGSPIASFACGSTEFTLSGEAGGETSGDLGVMSTTSQTVFKPGAGYQALKAQETSGSSLEATLAATATTTGAEAFELAERQ